MATGVISQLLTQGHRHCARGEDVRRDTQVWVDCQLTATDPPPPVDTARCHWPTETANPCQVSRFPPITKLLLLVYTFCSLRLHEESQLLTLRAHFTTEEAISGFFRKAVSCKHQRSYSVVIASMMITLGCFAVSDGRTIKAARLFAQQLKSKSNLLLYYMQAYGTMLFCFERQRILILNLVFMYWRTLGGRDLHAQTYNSL